MAARPAHRPGSLLLLALLPLALSSPGCGSDVEAGGPESQAGVLSSDPLAEVAVDGRWSSLSAHNGRRQKSGDGEGRREGSHTFWHDNGVKKGEGRFEDSRKVGPWTWWYESGQKRWEGSYVDDRPEGFERAWFENGELEYEGTFQGEKRKGLFTRWYDTGQIEVGGEYHDGLRQGVFHYWRYDGTLDRERSGVYAGDVKAAELPD